MKGDSDEHQAARIADGSTRGKKKWWQLHGKSCQLSQKQSVRSNNTVRNRRDPDSSRGHQWDIKGTRMRTEGERVQGTTSHERVRSSNRVKENNNSPVAWGAAHLERSVAQADEVIPNRNEIDSEGRGE